MSNRSERFNELMVETSSPSCITFVDGEPVVVAALGQPEAYQQPGRGVTRYRVLVAHLTEDDVLEKRQITLPATATAHFVRAAKHGGFVAVTMQNTPDGIRYWSRTLTSPLTPEEQAFVELHRAPAVPALAERR